MARTRFGCFAASALRNLHKLKATVFAFNAGAIRCYEKCGFIREGVLRDEIYREGKYHDAIEMALIRKTEDEA